MLRAVEDGTSRGDGRPGLGARVVEARLAVHLEAHSAAHDMQLAHEHRAIAFYRTDGHEVDELADAVWRQEARHEHVGVGPVELLLAHRVALRSNAEVASSLRIEKGREDTRRIETRIAEPVDRAVHSHECRGAHVAHDAVVLDGQVAHTAFAQSVCTKLPGRSIRS